VALAAGVDVLAGRPLGERETAEGAWRLGDTKANYLRVVMVALRRPSEADPAQAGEATSEPGVGLRLVPEGVPFR
jgi:hypothetical protein